MKTNVLKVLEEDSGSRLDKFLSLHLPISRSQIQKMIKNYHVKVDEKTAKPNLVLREGQIVSWHEPSRKEKPQAKRFRLEIVAETDEYFVVNKPAGLVVHPAEKTTGQTLVDLLEERYPLISRVGNNAQRPGIVHRLDKDVSGLMVAAKNDFSYQSLKRQFKQRRVVKEYLALVFGLIEKDSGKIDFPIARSAQDKRMMAAKPSSQSGRPAETDFEVITRYQKYTYLKCRIKTGRTHQIRVHFKALGHPVVGDKIYQIKKFKPVELGRIFLHSAYLAFEDLSGRPVSFTSQLPAGLKDFLKKLK